MNAEWQNLTNGSFKGVPFHVAIPTRDQQYGVESEEMAIERRLQFIKRPGIDGAPVRDWGADPETFTAVVEFFGVNHAKTAEAFLQKLNEGTPGPLILPTSPKAVLAYFWKRTRSTHYRDGNAIRITVTWVAANEIKTAGTGKATAYDLDQVSIDSGKAKLDSDVSNALSVLQDNPILSAVRTFESGISRVRSVVNAVLTLEQGIRTRIATLDAEIKGCLSLIKSATDIIHSDFSPSKASSRTSASTSLGTDSETGQTVIDYTEPDTIPAAADPLAKPGISVTIDIPTNNLGSPSGVANFGSQIADLLGSDRDELTEKSGGRTEDVSRALTAVLISLSDYIQAVQGSAPIEYVLRVDMSLGEAMFFNGIDLSQLREILRANPQVDDPFFIPKGTTLYL